MRAIDISGQRFGRLVVLNRAFASSWLCQCDCGAMNIVEGHHLKSGATRSCGCFARETRNVTHGMRHTPIWHVWAQMIQRCTNPRNKKFADYGGRGIVVCDRWRDFGNFFADMGERPSAKHSIDRRDNDGNYEPDNCRWATAVEQARNRRARCRREHCKEGSLN